MISKGDNDGSDEEEYEGIILGKLECSILGGIDGLVEICFNGEKVGKSVIDGYVVPNDDGLLDALLEGEIDVLTTGASLGECEKQSTT